MSGIEGKRPIRRALISVFDKTGLIRLAKGLHDAGVDIVSTGSTAKTIADARYSSDTGGVRHRFSRSARRSGQNVCIRISTPACWPTRDCPRTCSALAEARDRAVRVGRRQPVSVHGNRRLRRERGRVRRADRHRRTLHGARRRQEPSERRGGSRPAGLRRRAGRRPVGRVHAESNGRSWRRWHSATPPSTTSRWRRG